MTGQLAAADYLALGFAPDRALADEFVDFLLAAAGQVPGAPPSADLLGTIVADCVGAATEVTIPLTGGLDSGGLLGAALEGFSARSIRCLTLGPATHPDVVSAQEICARNGISHLVLSPQSIEWDLDRVCEVASRFAGETLPPLDGLYTFAALAELVPPGSPVLSGHLGYLAKGANLRDGRAALELFLEQNNGLLDNRHLLGQLNAYVTAHQGWKSTFQGLTDTDLLELGFRQRQRIRPAMTNPFTHNRRPYEDPRWVGAWLGLPISDRENLVLYRRLFTEGYPRVFAGRFQPGPVPRLYRSVQKRLPKSWKDLARRAKPSTILGRGDPRTNPSLGRVAREVASAFDSRHLTRTTYMPQIEHFIASPSDQGFSLFKWILSTEVYLRLGKLT